MKDPKISAVIFDIDGLIIDSEPLWKIAEIETFKEVGFDFTIEMCALTTGMRIDASITHWIFISPPMALTASSMIRNSSATPRLITIDGTISDEMVA